MKKLITLLAAVSLLIFLVSPSHTGMRVVGGGLMNAAGCALDATGKWETEDRTFTLLFANAYGQSFEVGAEGDVCQICVLVAGDASGTFALRLDDDTDMSSEYMEDLGTSDTITSQEWYCFTSSDNDTLATSTTYYIALKDITGTTDWHNDSGAGYGSGQAIDVNSGWNLGSGLGHDFTFRIYLK